MKYGQRYWSGHTEPPQRIPSMHIAHVAKKQNSIYIVQYVKIVDNPEIKSFIKKERSMYMESTCGLIYIGLI